jgi:hypothetical protein
MEVDVFKLIDQFYGKRKLNSLEKMISISEKKIAKKSGKKNEKKRENINNKNEIIRNDLLEELDIDNLYTFNLIQRKSPTFTLKFMSIIEKFWIQI